MKKLPARRKTRAGDDPVAGDYDRSSQMELCDAEALGDGHGKDDAAGAVRVSAATIQADLANLLVSRASPSLTRRLIPTDDLGRGNGKKLSRRVPLTKARTLAFWLHPILKK